MLLKYLLPILLAATLAPAFAKEAAPAAADPAAEARMMALSSELRCLVCQNQTIADSNADLAVDLRGEIREKIQSGMSDAEIKDFMVARYGDFVLYRPPVKTTTLILWIGPFLLLAVGGGILYVNLKRRRQTVADPELSRDDQALAESLLQTDKSKETT
jgi:cytochrome c-type biogenesis protein CcmH